MLEYLITSKTKRNLLKLLLTNPDRAFYIRELARCTGEPVNAIRRELLNLEKAGLVVWNKQGKEMYYSVVKDCPIYPELKRIIYATIGSGDYLREKIENIDQIDFAFIFGSVASNTETIKSDIDLFIVGAIDEDKIHRIVAEIEGDINRTINYTLMDKKEYEQRLKRGEPFIKRILTGPKIIVRGNPDDNRIID